VITEHCIVELSNYTNTINHHDRTLFEHLFGTYTLLQNLGKPKHVCLAGLYHSVYETEYFQFNSPFTRPMVQKLIGEQAETIVYEFCNTVPRTTNLVERRGNWSNQMYADLLDVDIAQLKEQGYYNDVIKTMEAIRTHLVLED
jgi:hypothetical protein